MGEEEVKKVDAETTSEAPAPPPAAPAPTPTPEPVAAEVPKDESKALVPVTPSEEKPDDSKALAIVEKAPDAIVEAKSAEGSVNRDAVLERLTTEKRLALILAWEDSEKSKAENKAQKKASSVGAWENSKKAAIEAELRQIEEKLEKKKAQYIEKQKNKIAALHKQAEEKRIMIEAKKGEELLKAEELAAKYKATGTGPKKFLGIF